MAKLIALYRHPADPAAFDAYYFNHHIPLAKTIAGLRRYEVNNTPVVTPDGDSPWHLVGVLSFDSMDALQQAMASPEGRAAAADLAHFAQAGVELLVFGTRDV